MDKSELDLILKNHILWLESGRRQGEQANLQGTDLCKANLLGADLSWVDLREADLQGANLQGANLRWADLRKANLQGANLQGANLEGANLQEANLNRTILFVDDLRLALLWRADLRGAAFDIRVAHDLLARGALLDSIFSTPWGGI